MSRLGFIQAALLWHSSLFLRVLIIAILLQQVDQSHVPVSSRCQPVSSIRSNLASSYSPARTFRPPKKRPLKPATAVTMICKAALGDTWRHDD